MEIINFVFPVQKTELEQAIDKILQQTHVSSHSFSDTNPINGSYFVVGKIKYKYSSAGVDHMNILFGKKQTVVIKYKGEIIYYFNTKEEVQYIREAIVTCFNEMKSKYPKDNKKEFHGL